MRWMLQLAVVLSVPLALFGALWIALRLLRWVRAHRAQAAAAGADVLVGGELGAFRAWLGDQVDGFCEGSAGGDASACDTGDGEGDGGGGD